MRGVEIFSGNFVWNKESDEKSDTKQHNGSREYEEYFSGYPKILSDSIFVLWAFPTGASDILP